MTIALAAPLKADEPFVVPFGDQFPILEEHMDRNRIQPDVGVDAQGRFVVVWSTRSDEDGDAGYGIRGKTFDQNGVAVGTEFMVNTYTTGDQLIPRVAMGADGGFSVAWMSEGSAGTDSSETSIQARPFNAAGVPKGPPMQVNTFTSGRQESPAIAADDQGNFVVTWANHFNAPDEKDDNRTVQARRFGSDGTPIGDAFRVGPPELDHDLTPAISMTADGSFVVAWSSVGTNGSLEVYGRRFHANADPAGATFLVNSETSMNQSYPDVSHLSDGSFTVVWRNEGSDADPFEESIEGRRFASDGTPVSSQFQIDTNPSSEAFSPQIATDSDGFLVAWGEGSFSPFNIFARSFEPTGQPSGDVFDLPTYTVQSQRGQRLGINADRQLVGVWTTQTAPGQMVSSSIQARIFRHPVIFTDGFESGDASAWMVVPAP